MAERSSEALITVSTFYGYVSCKCSRTSTGLTSAGVWLKTKLCSALTAKQLPCFAAHLVVFVAESYFKPCARLDPAELRTEGRIRAHCAFAVPSSVNGRGKVLVQLRRMWNFLLDNQGLKHMSLMDTIVKGKSLYHFLDRSQHPKESSPREAAESTHQCGE